MEHLQKLEEAEKQFLDAVTKGNATAASSLGRLIEINVVLLRTSSQPLDAKTPLLDRYARLANSIDAYVTASRQLPSAAAGVSMPPGAVNLPPATPPCATPRIRITPLHPEAVIVCQDLIAGSLPGVDAERAAVAVRSYVVKAMTAIAIIAPDGPGLEVNATGWTTLFRWRLPKSCTLAAVSEGTEKQKWQQAFSDNGGQGYLACQEGVDLWGSYATSMVGSFFNVAIQGDLDALTNLSRAVDIDIQLNVPAVDGATVDVVPDWMRSVYGVDVPWHVLRTEAYKLVNFIGRFAICTPRPSLLPRTHVNPATNNTWNVEARAYIATRPCDTAAALAMFDKLLVHRQSNKTETGFLLCGLPGAGKTTVATQLAFALGLRPTGVPIGKLMGALVGDSSAAMAVLFSRGYGDSGMCLFVLDEIDLISNPKDEKNKEAITQLLDSFTQSHKPHNTIVFGSTNNERSILGAVMSRFSAMRVVCAPDYKWHKAFFRSQPDHPMLAGLTDAQKQLVPLACVGLTARDVIDVPENVEGASAGGVPLCEARQLKKGNCFVSNRLEKVGSFSIALHTLSADAEPLRDFLIAAAKKDLLTGRMILFSDFTDRGWTAFIDIEVRELSETVELAGADPARPYIFRAGRWTRCYGPLPLMDIYSALLHLACENNATHFNYVTEEFMSHVVGAATEQSLDERRGIALRLVADYCLAHVPSATIFVPQSALFVEASSGLQDAGRVGNRAALEAFITMIFKASPAGKFRWTIAHCTIAEEVRQLASASGFHLSSLIELKLATTDATFQCVRCNKADVSNTDKGCRHVAAGGSAEFLPKEENDKRLAFPKDLRLCVVLKQKAWKPMAPFYTVLSHQPTFENVVGISFPGCAKNAMPCATDDPNAVPALTFKCNTTGTPHVNGPQSSVLAIVTKQEQTDDVRYAFAKEVDDLTAFQSVKVCCAQCNGDIGSEGRYICTAATHVRPSFEDFNVAPEEVGVGLCQSCPSERRGSHPYCRYCARLLLPDHAHYKHYGLTVVGISVRATCHIDGPLMVDVNVVSDIKEAAGAQIVVGDLLPVTERHERKPQGADGGPSQCRHCSATNSALTEEIWQRHMAEIPCHPLAMLPRDRVRGRRTTGDIHEYGMFKLVNQGGTHGARYFLEQGLREKPGDSMANRATAVTVEMGQFMCVQDQQTSSGTNALCQGLRRSGGMWRCIPEGDVFRL